MKSKLNTFDGGTGRIGRRKRWLWLRSPSLMFLVDRRMTVSLFVRQFLKMACWLDSERNGDALQLSTSRITSKDKNAKRMVLIGVTVPNILGYDCGSNSKSVILFQSWEKYIVIFGLYDQLKWWFQMLKGWHLVSSITNLFK